MSARHNTSHDQRSNYLQHGETQLYKEQQKIPDGLAPLSHSPLNLGYRPNSSTIGYPLIMPTMAINVTDTTYRLNHGDRGSNYVRLTASGTSLTLIFQGLVKGKAEVVILDITINNPNFTSFTIQPAINNLTLPAISNGARFILEIIAFRDLDGNIHYQQLNGGSGGVVSTPTTGLTFPLVYAINDIGLVGGSGGSRNVNIDLGDSTAPHIHKITLAQNARINFTNVPQSNQGLFFVLQIQQDADGAHGIFSPQAVTDWDLDLSPNALTILTGMAIGGDVYITNFGSRITQVIEGSGGSAEDWANHPAVGTVDLAGNVARRVGILQFNPQSNVVSQITANANGVIYTAGALRGHQFQSHLGNPLLTVGMNNIDVHGMTVDNTGGLMMTHTKSIQSAEEDMVFFVRNDNNYTFHIGDQHTFRLNNGGLDMNEDRIHSVSNLTFHGTVPEDGHIRLPRAGQIAWQKLDENNEPDGSLILDVNLGNKLRVRGGPLTMSGNHMEFVGYLALAPGESSSSLPAFGEIRMGQNHSINWLKKDGFNEIELKQKENALSIEGGNLNLNGSSIRNVYQLFQAQGNNQITFRSDAAGFVSFYFNDEFTDTLPTAPASWDIRKGAMRGSFIILDGGLVLNNSGVAPVATGFSVIHDENDIPHIWMKTGNQDYNLTSIATGGGSSPPPTIGGVSLSALSSNIIPDTTQVRDLGSSSIRWNNLFVNEITATEIDLSGQFRQRGSSTTQFGIRGKTAVAGRAWIVDGSDVGQPRRQFIQAVETPTGLDFVNLIRAFNTLLKDLEEQGIIV